MKGGTNSVYFFILCTLRVLSCAPFIVITRWLEDSSVELPYVYYTFRGRFGGFGLPEGVLRTCLLCLLPRTSFSWMLKGGRRWARPHHTLKNE